MKAALVVILLLACVGAVSAAPTSYLLLYENFSDNVSQASGWAMVNKGQNPGNWGGNNTFNPHCSESKDDDGDLGEGSGLGGWTKHGWTCQDGSDMDLVTGPVGSILDQDINDSALIISDTDTQNGQKALNWTINVSNACGGSRCLNLSISFDSVGDSLEAGDYAAVTLRAGTTTIQLWNVTGTNTSAEGYGLAVSGFPHPNEYRRNNITNICQLVDCVTNNTLDLLLLMQGVDDGDRGYYDEIRVVGFSVPPTLSPITPNASFHLTHTIRFNSTVTNATPLSTFIFSTNHSGSWLNVSNGTFAASNIAEANLTITAAAGTKVGAIFFANSTGQAFNQSDQYTFTTLPPCLTPIENQNISTPGTVLLCNPGGNTVYQLNDSDVNGSIAIRASNVILDCQGATIRGNTTLNSEAIRVNGFSDVIVRNCIVENFRFGMFAGATSHNVSFISNTYRNMRGTYSFGNMNLSSINGTYINASIYLASPKSARIIGNNITCSDTCGDRSDAIFIQSTKDALIQGNSWTKSRLGLQVFQNNSGVNVTQNLVTENDRGISINFYVDNVPALISGNTFINNTAGYDSYDLAGSIRHSTNVHWVNNSHYNITTASIIVVNSTNVNISNNSFQVVSSSSRPQFSGTRNDQDENEIPSVVIVRPTYKSYLGDSTEGAADNVTKFTRYLSNNITFKDNTFSGNLTAYLTVEGSNVTQNVPYNYFVRYTANANKRFFTEHYLKESNVTLYNDDVFNTPALTGVVGIMYNRAPFNQGGREFNLTINYPSLTFKNTNLTANYNLTINNLSSPFDDVRNVSNGVLLATNVQSFNVTLLPSQQVEVGDFGSPVIVPSSPVNGSTGFGSSFTFAFQHFNLSAPEPKWCAIRLNGLIIKNHTDGMGSSGSTVNFGYNLNDYGTYNWNVTCQDNLTGTQYTSNNFQVTYSAGGGGVGGGGGVNNPPPPPGDEPTQQPDVVIIEQPRGFLNIPGFNSKPLGTNINLGIKLRLGADDVVQDFSTDSVTTCVATEPVKCQVLNGESIRVKVSLTEKKFFTYFQSQVNVDGEVIPVKVLDFNLIWFLEPKEAQP